MWTVRTLRTELGSNQGRIQRVATRLGYRSALDASVNRSLGSQVMWQLRGVEPGTCVVAVGI